MERWGPGEGRGVRASFAWEPGSPAAGLDVTVGPESPTGAGDLSYAVVTVAGLEFELVWFRPG